MRKINHMFYQHAQAKHVLIIIGPHYLKALFTNFWVNYSY